MKSLVAKILEHVDDENEDESIEHKVTEASEITYKITWALVRIDSTLKSLQVNSPITSNPSTSSRNVSFSPQSGLLLNGATAASNVEIRAKLPKLEMKRSMVDRRSGKRSSIVLTVLFIQTRNLVTDKRNHVFEVPCRRSSRSGNQRAALYIGKLQLGKKDLGGQLWKQTTNH